MSDALAPIGIDVREVIRVGLRARPESEWHRNPCSDGVWRWHASRLAWCPRGLILERAGFGTDPRAMADELTAEMGHNWHERMERWLWLWAGTKPDVDVVHTEKGYWHPTLPLAAKADALISKTNRLIVIDYKTEHENAAKRRAADARLARRYTAAKPEHMVQVVADAMILEQHLGVPIERGALWYFSKNNGWPDQQPVDLTDRSLRDYVVRRVEYLEAAWATWETTRALPPPLPVEAGKAPWQCQAQKGSNFGRWCPARDTCMTLLARQRAA